MKAINRKRFFQTIFLTLFFFLATCGCVNLTAIREFADISSATAEHTNLTKQYASWPITQKRYQPQSQHTRLEEMAKIRNNQEPEILLRHSIIEEYMDALGQLAGDEVVTYDKEVDALGKATKNAKLIDEKEQSALQTIASLILKSATDAWRQDKLKKLVNEANSDIQVVLQGLKQIVDQGFLGDIDDEREAIGKYYNEIISKSHDMAGIAALNEWRQNKLDALTKREKAIKSYSKSIDKISQGHQRLYEGVLINDIRSKELLGQMSRYAKELRKAYESIEAL